MVLRNLPKEPLVAIKQALAGEPTIGPSEHGWEEASASWINK